MKMESKHPERNWDRRLQEVAASFQYPATPDIATAVYKQLSAPSAPRPAPDAPHWIAERRRLAMAALIALFALATLLAVPTVRAAIARFLQIGAITIFVTDAEEEATRPSLPAALPTKRPAPTANAATTTARHNPPPAIPDTMLVTPQTAAPTVTRGPALEGPLAIAEAAEAANFEIQLPDTSTALGPPDEIYLQRSDSTDALLAVILVWSDPQGLETPRLTLYQIGVPQYGLKEAARKSLLQSEVNDQPAYWIEGDHLLQIPEANGDLETRLVGNVLLWTEGDVTYRLEGVPTIDDAVIIAESLAPAIND